MKTNCSLFPIPQYVSCVQKMSAVRQYWSSARTKKSITFWPLPFTLNINSHMSPSQKMQPDDNEVHLASKLLTISIFFQINPLQMQRQILDATVGCQSWTGASWCWTTWFPSCNHIRTTEFVQSIEIYFFSVSCVLKFNKIHSILQQPPQHLQSMSMCVIFIFIQAYCHRCSSIVCQQTKCVYYKNEEAQNKKEK